MSAWTESNFYGDEAGIEWSLTGEETDVYVIHPPEGDQWEAIGLVHHFMLGRAREPWEEKSLGSFDTKLEAMKAAETWLAEIDEAARWNRSRLADGEQMRADYAGS